MLFFFLFFSTSAPRVVFVWPIHAFLPFFSVSLPSFGHSDRVLRGSKWTFNGFGWYWQVPPRYRVPSNISSAALYPVLWTSVELHGVSTGFSLGLSLYIDWQM